MAAWRCGHAAGDEKYLTFSGEVEHPAAGEVIFADEDGQAHARRWTNRQSGLSAVQDSTADVLIVAEALHASAATDVPALLAAITAELARGVVRHADRRRAHSSRAALPDHAVT